MSDPWISMVLADSRAGTSSTLLFDSATSDAPPQGSKEVSNATLTISCNRLQGHTAIEEDPGMSPEDAAALTLYLLQQEGDQ